MPTSGPDRRERRKTTGARDPAGPRFATATCEPSAAALRDRSRRQSTGLGRAAGPRAESALGLAQDATGQRAG